mmetsp:Transcript_43126/g.119290  ORF Transcript_43126/g.119290 Transcript_43126/m.119290 type:complete len:332 (-) Transcript_43126:12-1007(-)
MLATQVVAPILQIGPRRPNLFANGLHHAAGRIHDGPDRLFEALVRGIAEEIALVHILRVPAEETRGGTTPNALVAHRTIRLVSIGPRAILDLPIVRVLRRIGNVGDQSGRSVGRRVSGDVDHLIPKARVQRAAFRVAAVGLVAPITEKARATHAVVVVVVLPALGSRPLYRITRRADGIRSGLCAPDKGIVDRCVARVLIVDGGPARRVARTVGTRPAGFAILLCHRTAHVPRFLLRRSCGHPDRLHGRILRVGVYRPATFFDIAYVGVRQRVECGRRCVNRLLHGGIVCPDWNRHDQCPRELREHARRHRRHVTNSSQRVSRTAVGAKMA